MISSFSDIRIFFKNDSHHWYFSLRNRSIEENYKKWRSYNLLYKIYDRRIIRMIIIINLSFRSRMIVLIVSLNLTIIGYERILSSNIEYMETHYSVNENHHIWYQISMIKIFSDLDQKRRSILKISYKNVFESLSMVLKFNDFSWYDIFKIIRKVLFQVLLRWWYVKWVQ